MGGEGRESKVCGPFLVVLSVTLWHNSANNDTPSSRAGGAAGSARARGVEHAQVEGQALRLVLGSNRSVTRLSFAALLLVVFFALLLYFLVACSGSPAECSTPQSRSCGDVLTHTKHRPGQSHVHWVQVWESGRAPRPSEKDSAHGCGRTSAGGGCAVEVQGNGLAHLPAAARLFDGTRVAA